MKPFQATGRSVWCVLILLGLCYSSPIVVRAADGPSTSAVARARKFIETKKRGQDIVGCVHFGARYGGHSYIDTVPLTQPGMRDHFALLYKLNWEDDGWTQIAFYFDGKGNIYDSKIIKHNATFQQPYAVANLSIVVVGNLMMEAVGDDLTREDRELLQNLIDNVDAEGLMELVLKLEQALE